MFRQISLLISLLAAIGLSGVFSAFPATAQTPPLPPGARFAPDEVVVQFKPGVSEAQKADARSRANAAHKRPIQSLARGDLEVAAIPPGLAVAAAVGALESHPAVAFAEPNWLYEHQETSNDPYYLNNQLWGMYGGDTAITPSIPANQFGSQAELAWGSNTGSSSIHICVIDEGVDSSHEDLGANIWGGRDFYSDDDSFFDGSGDDHGTHVAGTIGARGGNGKGVAGMVWSVGLISAKFLGPNGGYLSDAIEAVDYCTSLKRQQGLAIVASNNSWGGGGYSQALHDAIIRAAKEEILFVAAAGNGNRGGRAQDNDSTAHYPSNYDTGVGTSTESAAGYDAVIAVAAIDSSGNKASWSNYGATTVDLGAPGVGVNSTLPGGGYDAYSGTSMATPHVSGAAALYASANASASANSIKNAILDAARETPTASMAGRTVTGGRLNVSTFRGSNTTSPSPSPTHDVAITAVAAPSSPVTGQSYNVDVTVKNEGTFDESVTVSLTDSAESTIGTLNPGQPMTIPAGQSSQVRFAWTPSAAEDHTLTGGVAQVSGETDTADNTKAVTVAVSQPSSGTPTFTLSVTRAGNGRGTVTSNPSGINCGFDCSEPYPANEQVTLTAQAANNSTFAGWSGGGCSGTAPCTVTMDASESVTATFSRR